MKQEKQIQMDEKLRLAAQSIQSSTEAQVLSNQFLADYFEKNGKSITSNEMVTLRRSLPFTHEMIIPVRIDTKGLRKEKSPMGYIRLETQEDYDNYQLTEKNFRGLTEEEIEYVRAQLKEKGLTHTRILLKFLTICDAIIIQNGREVFRPLKERVLVAYIRETPKTVRMILDTLTEIHAISRKGNLYRWNSPAQRKEDEDFLKDFNQSLSLDKDDKNENKGLDSNTNHDKMESEKDNLDQPDEGMELLKSLYFYMKKKDQNYADAEKIRHQAAEMEAENQELLSQLQAYRVMEKEYKNLIAENKRLKRETSQYAENIKDYSGFKKTVQQRLDTVMDHFSDVMDETVQEFRQTHNSSHFNRRVRDIVTDTSHSIMNMVTAIKR